MSRKQTKKLLKTYDVAPIRARSATRVDMPPLNTDTAMWLNA